MSIDAMERLWRRLLHAVGRGRVTIVQDGGPVQKLQATLNAASVRDELPRLAEYGLASRPPAGADVVVLCIGGNPSDMVVIATGHQTYRLRNLGDGEVAIHDDKGQRVHLSAVGIVIDSGILPVTINAGGGLLVNGNTTFAGTVTANGKRIDETHHHVPDSRGDTQGPVA